VSLVEGLRMDFGALGSREAASAGAAATADADGGCRMERDEVTRDWDQEQSNGRKK
jgi:hypothetical protein